MDLGRHRLARRPQQRIAEVALQPFRHLDHVFAGVTALRDVDFAAEQLLIARVQCLGKHLRLRARVVHQVLALHFVARRL